MLDPTFTTSLHFSDFGSVYSADGREHPVTAMTPVYSVNDSERVPVTNAPAGAVTTPMVPVGWPDWLKPDFLKDQHIGARFVVGVVAVGLILVVALRITR